MDRKTKIPITRLNMWFDQSDFELETDFAKEYLENDSNFRVVLFRVDHTNTQYDDLYGESEAQDIRYKPPVELVVSALKIEPAELAAYVENRGFLTRRDRGPLTFAVLEETLKENDVDFRVGDFVGYAVTENGLQYWQVSNDGRVNTDNQHSMYGIRSYARSITCVPVDSNQFNAL